MGGRRMKILLCHNFYQQAGGEDQVFAAEAALLRDMGEQVFQFVRDNKTIKEIDTAGVAMAAIWNRQSYRDLRGLVNHHRPDVVHFHNTFPLMSPAVYY